LEPRTTRPLLVFKVREFDIFALALFNVKVGKVAPISMDLSAGAAAAASLVGEFDSACSSNRRKMAPSKQQKLSMSNKPRKIKHGGRTLFLFLFLELDGFLAGLAESSTAGSTAIRLDLSDLSTLPSVLVSSSSTRCHSGGLNLSIKRFWCLNLRPAS
jgi:hypothetical protein